MTDRKAIDKAHRAYWKAECDLVHIRNELFPPGTKVECKFPIPLTATVKAGSLYADQVLTEEWGHMAWNYLERIKADD